ncbi:biotin--[acetyl-CoA-carboxylase] ligase [Aurantimonas sp. VKM B-3413]|uniref:biotin--[acetyl-CoA-carboxylase] ligase n=1 Tax=Aurantimonas sp. VKM B-3413 TaxID=2779401 RepID=UPI001E3BB441|nr:biotin--[acetyl-CoA-carboxylase] ligase [Aurantimonas sp. VKM B-3413]
MSRAPETERRRLAFAEVGSTNTLALEAARAGDPGPLWVTAERQSAGRGRRGRAWVSEAGNLYASWLVVDPAPVDQLSNLPLVASLGVRDGLARLLGDRADRAVVKWPNDVLIGGKKAVGILLESERLPDGRMAVVVGCGVNVAHVPTEAPYGVTSLKLEAAERPLDIVFDAVAGAVEAAFALFRRGEGFGEVRRQWLSLAVGLGEPCRVNLADRSIEGRFEALDPQGRLILRQDDGRTIAIAAGDLFFLGADAREMPGISASGEAEDMKNVSRLNEATRARP